MFCDWRHAKWLIGGLCASLWTVMGGGFAIAAVKETSVEEAACKEIGFRPKTIAYADCVLELLSRKEAGGKTAVSSGPSHTGRAEPRPKRTPSRPQPALLAPNEQTCLNYGFKRATTAFSQCVLQIDQAQRQAELEEQRYQFELQQYQQQMAAYQSQQEAIKKEKDRRKWEAIGRLGAGMANSRSPSFLGALNEGLAAANGQIVPQPTAPAPPASRTQTLILPNGQMITCRTTGRLTNCF